VYNKENIAYYKGSKVQIGNKGGKIESKEASRQ
jgi:hypothetical protein